MQQGLSPSTFNSAAGFGNSSAGSGRRRSWIPPTPAELAPRFPQLEIVELLGQGGMGAVYKVRQRDLDRWAALKVLSDDVAHDPNFSERFQREARALALLGHQHIVIVYEFGQRDGVYFLLMEFIDGVTLRQAIRARQITDRDALAIVAQICEALQFAHDEGVVHRDIKPENILIDKRGRVKIADFGLAKLLGRSFEVPTLTGTHQVMGTPVYMAPEQMEGTRGVDHRADIFSLGVVFYELLTGELPLGRFAPPSQKYQLDVRLDDVVLRTLEKEPDRRYQQASDVKCDVETIRNQPPMLQLTQPAIPPVKEKKARKRWTWRKRFTVFLLGSSVVFAALITSVAIAERNRFIWGLNYRNEQLTREIAEAKEEAKAALERLNRRDNKPPSKVTSLDPNEINAIVQLTTDGPRLNPMFGINPLQGTIQENGAVVSNRDAVNRVLATVHQEFLAIESRHIAWDKRNDGTQVTVIEKFEEELKQLENWLWKAIDSRLPFEQQKFLRTSLPLFADVHQPLPLVQASPSNPGRSTPIQTPSGVSQQEGVEQSSFPTNMRYMQIFGWKQTLTDDDIRLGRKDLFPIRVTIGRQGNWYRWSIEVLQDVSGFSEDGPIPAKKYSMIDSGYDPELPSGLKRFWRDGESVEPFSPSEQKREPSPDPEVAINKLSLSEDEFRNPRMRVDDDVEQATNDAQFRRRVQPPQQEELDRFEIPGRTIIGSEPSDEFAGDLNPTRFREVVVESEELQVKSFDEELNEVDALIVGDETRWDLVNRRIDEMLRKYPGRSEQGRIYCKAVSAYGGKRLRWHAADVSRFAKEGLKFERNLVERGKLFLTLGIVAEIHDNDPESFVESRAEATRWYLKGYAELLPFHLPDQTPELPKVEPIDENAEDDAVEINPEQIAAHVRREAQLNLRKQAEFTRDLVERRDAYLGRLKELFGRLHQANDNDSVASEKLHEIATEVLRDPQNVAKLIDSVGPVKKVLMEDTSSA